MIYLTRRYAFSASHRLHNDALSEEENRRIYGKCNNPYGHGHNYALEVTLAGEISPVTGMVVDLTDLDQFVNQQILERFDHRNLNTLEDFSTQVPTSEMLCKTIYEILKQNFRFARPGGLVRIERVRLEETSLNSFEYPGNGLHGTR